MLPFERSLLQVCLELGAERGKFLLANWFTQGQSVFVAWSEPGARGSGDPCSQSSLPSPTPWIPGRGSVALRKPNSSVGSSSCPGAGHSQRFTASAVSLGSVLKHSLAWGA